MDSRYLLVLSNKKIYKEVEIPRGSGSLSVGTDNTCDARLRKDDFFEPVCISLTNNNDTWQVTCADNLYISDSGVAKLLAKKLEHGSEFEVRYQSSDQLVFKAEFQIDFAGDKHYYDRAYDVNNCSSISFGDGADSDIQLRTPYTKTTRVVLSRNEKELSIKQDKSAYGIYLNGRKAAEGEVIRETDFFSISDCFFYYKDNKIWTDASENNLSAKLQFSEHKAQADYPKFTRNTRIKTVINDEKIEILDPPAKPQKPKNNLVLRLLPSLGMLIASGVMAFFGGMMIALSAISGLMAVITTVATIRESNKDYKHDSEERVTKYNAYAEKKREEIKSARNEERSELEEIYISTDEELKRLHSFSPNLFDRQREDEDFLCVRLGEGRVEAKREINYKKQERLEVEDELQNIPAEINEEFKYVDDAPVVCDFKKDHAVGICGDEPFRYEFLKKIIVDITSRHYHSDVRIAFVTDDEYFDWVDDMRYLPHVINPVTGMRNIACDEESKNQLFEYLYNELTAREEQQAYSYNIVIFFVDEFGFKHHPISRFVEKAEELGVTFVFFEESQDKLPQGCVHVIAPKDDDQTGVLIDSSDKNKSIEFEYVTITDDQMQEIIRILAPVYTEELSLEGSLTRSLSLFELLGILSADDIDLRERWNNSQAFKTMKAPIGISNMGTVELDLHDKAHGPHGLVAGTTGSGKSELLLTYIISMAALYHPYEVGFVIIDFKGGGMANQLRTLPHLIGTITNIDGKEINRSLKSIKAELQKRQRLFADANVNHIDSYIRKYRNHEVTIPLPHLIIVVDEFAELKAEQPDFMKELISAARIGRSLGVHLILATQKPAGQVDDQIWSNSRFKLCLKVQGPEDSNEVLKSPLAAEIKEPGRAYLQVGNNEIFELFQSGYSGAPEREGDSDVREFAIHELQNNGQKSVVYQQKRHASDNGKTQLDALVDHIADYTEEQHIEKLPPICLPPLPEMIPFPEKLPKTDEVGIIADIGVYDDPDNQIQAPYSINLTNENVMIIGSAQTGKTNLLQTIIRSITTKFTPEDVNIYIIDFASMFLKNYEGLAHVGGVATPSDEEKLDNLFKMLNEELISRKSKLYSSGVSSYAAYKEAGKRDIPQICLLIDNLAALRELEMYEENIITILREGLSVGISVIVTNNQTTGIGYRYYSCFGESIALHCFDQSEYSTLFGYSKQSVDDKPGRCLIKLEKRIIDAQIYNSFSGEKEVHRKDSIDAFINSTNNMYRDRARQIPMVPEIVRMTEYVTNNTNWPVGIDYETIEPVLIDLNKIVSLGVIGENIDKETIMSSLLVYLEQYANAELFIADDYYGKLRKLKNAKIKKNGRNADDYNIIVDEILSELEFRYEHVAHDSDQYLYNRPTQVLLINGTDFFETSINDRAMLEKILKIIDDYKSLGVCIIAFGIENRRIPGFGADLLKRIIDNGNVIMVENLKDVKAYDISYADAKRFSSYRQAEDMYFVTNGDLRRLKLAK